jgi:hypothetical protein
VTDEILNGFANYLDNRVQAFEAPIEVVAQSSPLQQIESQLVNIQQGPIDGQTGEQDPIDAETVFESSKTHGVPTYKDSDHTSSSCRRGSTCPPVQTPTCGCYYYSCCQSTFCFSADTTVRLSDGAVKRMDELNVNDWIMSANGSRVKMY